MFANTQKALCALLLVALVAPALAVRTPNPHPEPQVLSARVGA
jgi:hypothetical protein